MEYKFLGKTREKLSEIGIGTWQLGPNREQNIESIHIALDNGVNFIDTAEIYGTEDTVGEVIKGRKNLFIATKVWATHFRYDDVIKACSNSLKRLGLKQIDLYQLHWPNPSIDIKETMSAMEKLVSENKIRYIGVSNFSKKQLIDAQNAMSKYEIVSNQVKYNVLDRDPEKDLSDYLRKEKMTLIAYSPLAHGDALKRKYSWLLDELGKIGKRYGKTPAQVMLNWLIMKKGVIPIPKASSPRHMLEDIESADFKLSSPEIKYIDNLTSVSGNKYKSSAAFRKVVDVYLLLDSKLNRKSGSRKK